MKLAIKTVIFIHVDGLHVVEVGNEFWFLCSLKSCFKKKEKQYKNLTKMVFLQNPIKVTVYVKIWITNMIGISAESRYEGTLAKVFISSCYFFGTSSSDFFENWYWGWGVKSIILVFFFFNKDAWRTNTSTF